MDVTAHTTFATLAPTATGSVAYNHELTDDGAVYVLKYFMTATGKETITLQSSCHGSSKQLFTCFMTTQTTRNEAYTTIVTTSASTLVEPPGVFGVIPQDYWVGEGGILYPVNELFREENTAIPPKPTHKQPSSSGYLSALRLLIF